MIKTSWKKSLVIAGVLTALCASAAFAAEQADTKPSMRERVGTILHHDEGDNYPDRPYHMERGRHWGGPMHPGPQLTDEQVKEREARRAEWEKMTPEERQKAHEEKYSKWREERMKNMTPEEKERFEQREKQREEWRKMVSVMACPGWTITATAHIQDFLGCARFLLSDFDHLHHAYSFSGKMCTLSEPCSVSSRSSSCRVPLGSAS